MSEPTSGIQPGTVADWVVGLGTWVVAFVALFQDWLRARFFAPRLRVSIVTADPDCVWMPFQNPSPFPPSVDSVHVRMRIWNESFTTSATDVEVYASELRRLTNNGHWQVVTTFPPMNLVWADPGVKMHMPVILPRTGKHCNVGHVVDPAHRAAIDLANPALGLTPAQTSLWFLLSAPPSHRGHVVPPDTYEFDVHVGARNTKTVRATILISLGGQWFPGPQAMLAEGIHVAIARQE